MSIVLLAAIGLGLVHVTVGTVDLRVPQEYWRSGAGGIAVAYVFVHLLPDLAERQETVSEQPLLGVGVFDLYVVAVVGFVAFYGVERVARTTPRPHDRTFWLHIGSFGLYNGFIGYLLHDQFAFGGLTFLFYIAAIGPHMAVIEYGLQHHHEGQYKGFGQWLLAAAVVFGAGVGYVIDFGPVATSLYFAVLAGGIVLNVVKEEVPEGRRTRFWPFAGAAIAYAVLLVLSSL